MRVLVTGSAGFIGFHVSDYLLKKNNTVIGIDNINDYYDVNLKKSRLTILKKNKNFIFHKFDLVNAKKLEDLIKTLVRNLLIGQELQPRFENVEQFKLLFQELLKV